MCYPSGGDVHPDLSAIPRGVRVVPERVSGAPEVGDGTGHRRRRRPRVPARRHVDQQAQTLPHPHA